MKPFVTKPTEYNNCRPQKTGDSKVAYAVSIIPGNVRLR